jgi:methionyl-tRNA synthetase
LSQFQQPLLDYYKQNPNFIQPEAARNEVVSFVSRELTDLSISRSKDKFDWGIDIPWDTDHVIYVWFDALLNYITAIGYGEDEAKLNSLWPASVQVVGKDILRFHAVIWPAMLMAAELKPAEKVFAHGWLLVGGEKMSKSKLTGIAPNQITEVFGSDAFRYYFMKAIAFGQDGSFSWEDLSARYQAELANGFGNLASRVVAMVHRYFDGVIPEAKSVTEADKKIQETAANCIRLADAAMDDVAIQDALLAIWELVDGLNVYLTEQEPWILAKDEDNRDRLGTILYTSLEGLRTLAVALTPFIPKATAKLWASIGHELGDLASQPLLEAASWNQLIAGEKINELESLFPRVEQEDRD